MEGGGKEHKHPGLQLLDVFCSGREVCFYSQGLIRCFLVSKEITGFVCPCSSREENLNSLFFVIIVCLSDTLPPSRVFVFKIVFCLLLRMHSDTCHQNQKFFFCST